MKRLLKHFDLIIVFVILFLVFLPRSINFCEEFNEANFDTQNLLVWSLSERLGVIPIKDTFYPYGLIFWYANSINIVYFIYILIAPSIYSIIYLMYKKLFIKFGYIHILLYLLFFIISTGLVPRIHPIDRYLFPLAFSSIILFIIRKYKGRLAYLITGLMSGLCIFYDIGSGVILSILSILSLIYIEYFDFLKYQKKADIRKICRNFIFYIVGIIIGITPYFIFIFKNDLFLQLLRFIKDIVSGSSYVKSPFLVLRKYNMFIFSTIFIQSIYLINAFNNKFKKYSEYFYYYLFSNYVISILLLQKHFLRQIWVVLMIYSIHAVILMFYPILITKYATVKNRFIYYVGILCFMSIFIVTFAIEIKPQNYIKDFNNGINIINENNFIYRRICSLDKFIQNDSVGNLSYYKVIEYLNHFYPNENIFSYPYDPIFYILSRKTTSPYLNVYEGSPKYAQKENIKFINDYNVKLVIYNINSEIVDHIPEYARAYDLTKYILLNYKPVKIIDNFIILGKVSQNDKYFIYDEQSKQHYSSLIDKLTLLNFGSLFFTDGYYHADEILNKGEIIYEGSNFKSFNEYLNIEGGKISDNLYLLIKYRENISETVDVDLVSEQNLVTKINFKPCSNNYCLINLSRLPAFYENHMFISLESKQDIKEILLIKYDKPDLELW